MQVRPFAVATIASRSSHPHFSPFRISISAQAVRNALLLMALSALVPVPQPVWAAEPTLEAPVSQKNYKISAGTLGEVLTQFASVAGVSITIPPALVQNKNSAGLNGNYTVRSGFASLLQDTDLDVISTGGDAFALRRHAVGASGSADVLPTVEVTAILNATSQGTDSYGARAVTVGKTAQSLREIPQSVSVITRQQMDDRNMVTIDDAMRSVTGVTVDSRGDGTPMIYSRGYEMEATYDGVSASWTTGWSQLGLAIYDRVEVLRGPAGLLQGSGEPGGTINYVRKRPLDKFRVASTVSVGSWNNYYTDLDVTGPLNESGTIRGRGVITAEDRDYFYDSGHNRQFMGYGALDIDLTSRTTLSLSLARQNSVRSGKVYTLPTYTNGSFLNAPRSTATGADWTEYRYPITEATAELTHQLDHDWRVKASVRARRIGFDTKYISTASAVNPANNTVTYSGGQAHWPRTYYDADINAAGPFELLGRKHELLIGYNSSYTKDEASQRRVTFANRDLFNPNINESDLLPILTGFDQILSQSALYGSARLKIADPVTLILGGRLSEYENRSINWGSPNWNVSRKQKNEFTPYAGIVWDLNKEFSLYASYTDIFIPQSGFDYMNERLDPRVGWQAETGIKAELMDGKLNASLALFRVRDENRSMTDPDPTHICATASTLCSMAAGLVQSEGWEAEVSGKLAANWNVTAGYTYNTTKYLKDTTATRIGQPLLTNVPKQLFKLWTNYRFDNQVFDGMLSDWSVGGGVTVQSKTYAGTAPAIIRQGGYAVAGLQVGYRFNRNVTVMLTVENLFDRSYYARVSSVSGGNYYGTPRNAMLTVRSAF